MIRDNENSSPWVLEQASAEAAAAVVNLCLALPNEWARQEAAWAARRAYETLDHFVFNQKESIRPHLDELLVANPQGVDTAHRMRAWTRAESEMIFKPGVYLIIVELSVS